MQAIELVVGAQADHGAQRQPVALDEIFLAEGAVRLLSGRSRRSLRKLPSTGAQAQSAEPCCRHRPRATCRASQSASCRSQNGVLHAALRGARSPGPWCRPACRAPAAHEGLLGHRQAVVRMVGALPRLGGEAGDELVLVGHQLVAQAQSTSARWAASNHDCCGSGSAYSAGTGKLICCAKNIAGR